MFMKKLAAVVFCLVCAQGTVNAQYRQNVITSAVVDRVGGLVLVSGQFGSNPLVTIDGMAVRVMSASYQMMVVEFPASLLNAPGTYLLTVTTNSGAKGTTFFEITIGATGPQGPRGADGASGPKGDAGPAGVKGDKGDKGEQGVAGRGDKGDKGDKGDTGSPGANGLNGTKGDKGDTGAAGQGSPRVVDADGKLVGTLVSADAVIVNIGNDWVRIALSGAGFASCSSKMGCVQYEFETTDCTGIRYMSVDGLAPMGYVIGDEIHHPSGAAAVRPVGSLWYDSGYCLKLDAGFMHQNAETKITPLSSLGLSGAFHLAW
jgi:hypothetical protein